MLYGKVLLRALGTRNLYSASTVDQFPKQMASALMFGTGTTVPVPDVDRTDHLLMLGANPLASNGSLMTAPDMRGRLRALRARGGKLVVIDPRRSRTAEEADEHHFIRPGTDAHLLFALVHVLFDEGLAAPGAALEELTDGIEIVRSLAEPFTPEAAAGVCGIDAVHDPPPGPRAGLAPRSRRVRPDRDLHPGVRHAGQLAGGRAQPAHRQPRSRGRRDVPARRRRTLQRRGPAGSGPRYPLRPLAQPGARPGRDLRRAAGGLPGRGDRDSRRGPGARPDHDRRQSGRLDSQQRPPRPGARADSSSWSASTSTSTRPPATPT